MIAVKCVECGQKLNAPPKLAGKAVACPKCRAVVNVPIAAQPNPPAGITIETDSTTSQVPPTPVPVVAETTAPRISINVADDRPQGEPLAAKPLAASSSKGFDIRTGANEAAPVRARRRKKPKGIYIVVGLVAALAIVGGAAGFALLQTSTPPLTLLDIEDQSIIEHQSITIDIPPMEEAWRGRLRYELKEAPADAMIDVNSGRFTWTPSEQQGANESRVVVHAQAGDRSASESFTISVAEHNSRPKFDKVANPTVTLGESLQLQLQAIDADDPPNRLRYELASDLAVGAEVNAETGLLTWTPDASFANNRVPIRVKAVEQTDGGHEALTQIIVAVLAASNASDVPVSESVAATQQPASPGFDIPARPLPETSDPLPSFEQDPVPTDRDEFEAVATLYAEKTLFKDLSYVVLRKYFADKFEREQQPRWHEALGDQAEDLDAWFADNIDLKEEFFTAIDPQHDDVPEVFRTFNTIRFAHPDKVSSYGSLAIATALVWDKPRGSVYDYEGHCRRCKSTMPSERPEALENFEYFLHTEQFMQGRGQYLPWEFLVHLVNHRTPFDERKWALSGYLQNRVMFGKCYKDVPYDTEMLESGSVFARMNDADYTLPNLKQFGGVCAMQADYAARVGKSLGVPAAYVSGESRFGGHHAWVMWVELQSVTPTSIGFSLESFGRYRGDKYYVGHLRDPQTGQRITDRQLELRLHVAGSNTRAKRHADMLMAAMPLLEQREPMDIDTRLRYLSSVLQLSPGNEAAWLAVGSVSSDAEVLEKRQKQMRKILDQFFLTFANFPDFTWEVFDDLVAFETDTNKRLQLYDRLSLLYVAAERPDLACEARIKLADLLIEADRADAAIEGLAVTIQRFPDEGRYVPRMLDKLEETCAGIEDSDQKLLAFYNSFIPRIQKFRGSRPSTYCIEMYERAIAVFKQHNQLQAAQAYQLQLDQIKAGKT